MDVLFFFNDRFESSTEFHHKSYDYIGEWEDKKQIH